MEEVKVQNIFMGYLNLQMIREKSMKDIPDKTD